MMGNVNGNPDYQSRDSFCTAVKLTEAKVHFSARKMKSIWKRWKTAFSTYDNRCLIEPVLNLIVFECFLSSQAVFQTKSKIRTAAGPGPDWLQPPKNNWNPSNQLNWKVGTQQGYLV